VAGLDRLRSRLHAPTALKDYGLAEKDIEPAAELCLAAVPAVNPRPVTRDDLRALLRAAWAGTPPTTWDPSS
jgi:maleylacetate reductase